jgi:hypothetical protein
VAACGISLFVLHFEIDLGVRIDQVDFLDDALQQSEFRDRIVVGEGCAATGMVTILAAVSKKNKDARMGALPTSIGRLERVIVSPPRARIFSHAPRAQSGRAARRVGAELYAGTPV